MWVTIRRLKGLCRVCENPRTNATYCDFHATRNRKVNRDYAKRRKVLAKQLGICFSCNRKATQYYCEYHSEIHRASRKNWEKTEKGRKYTLEYQKQWQKNYRAKIKRKELT